MAASETESLATDAGGSSKSKFKQFVKVLVPAIKAHLVIKKNHRAQKKSEDHSSTVVSSPQTPDFEFTHLEEKMDTSHLEELMVRFKTTEPDSYYEEDYRQSGTPDSMRSNKQYKGPGVMDLEEFQSSLFDMLDLPIWDTVAVSKFKEQAEQLFRKIDRTHEGVINWDDFCTYIIMRFQEQELSSSSKELPFINKPRIVRVSNIKETVSKVMLDHNPTRYVTVSKEGIIGVWATNLQLKRTIEMLNITGDNKSSTKRRTRIWVTDAICLPNVHKLVMATTNRDLYFYDMSTPKYAAQFHLSALPSVPMCLDYYYDKKNRGAKSIVVFGTDRGDIHLLTFVMPIKGMFETPFKKSDSSWQIYFSDLHQHSRFVSHVLLPQVHSDWIRRIRYIPENDMLMSCSSSSKESLVFRDVDEKKRKTYTFRVMKGIDCFDYSKDLSIIASGGVDHVIRLWDPYVTLKPVAILKGHQSSIIDVAINEDLGQVFSYSKDGLLKAWDIKDHSCVQSIAIKLPFGNQTVDHGAFPLLLARSLNTLIISVDDCLAELKLGMGSLAKKQSTSHERPLCTAIYNPYFRQVITGCEGSEVNVWDLETGRKLLHFRDVHDGEELSCLAIDSKGQRIITGARDGSGSVWNLVSGLREKKLAAYEDGEITGIIALPNKEKILTVGWSRKLLMYDDTTEGGTAVPDPNWAKLPTHKDDILSLSYYPHNLLATSSFDGGIYVWTLEREKLYRKVKDGTTGLLKKKTRHAGVVTPKEEKETPSAPIDKVLFLANRSLTDSAVLVAAEAGKVEFWSLFGISRPAASFFAASALDSTVLALGTDAKNKYLLTGDAKGVVCVWDIAKYCLFRSFADVVVQATNIKDMNVEIITTPPEKLNEWTAHSSHIVSTEFILDDSKEFVLTGSVDYTAKLWTLEGFPVGTFGRKPFWNLSDPASFQGNRSRKRGMKKERRKVSERKPELEEKQQNADAESSDKSDENVNHMPVFLSEEKRPYTTSSLPDLSTSSSLHGMKTISRDVQVWANTDYYRSRSMILDSISKRKETWSILGDNYNEGFKRRMRDRQYRRNHYSYKDCAGPSEGALSSSVCSPFKALSTPETRDFQLPKGLPLTPRMVSKGIDPYQPNSLERLFPAANLPAVSKSTEA